MISRESSNEALVLRSRLELGEMVFEPGVTVCFQLEYTLTLPAHGHASVHGKLLRFSRGLNLCLWSRKLVFDSDSGQTDYSKIDIHSFPA